MLAYLSHTKCISKLLTSPHYFKKPSYVYMHSLPSLKVDTQTTWLQSYLLFVLRILKKPFSSSFPISLSLKQVRNSNIFYIGPVQQKYNISHIYNHIKKLKKSCTTHLTQYIQKSHHLNMYSYNICLRNNLHFFSFYRVFKLWYEFYIYDAS